MDSNIRKIIESATLAPSGENCQPWKFIINGSNIKLMNLPERDQSLYSWGQRASYMANGAAIENIVIAASNFGFIAEVKLFPDKNDQNFVASIELKSGAREKDSLYEHIPFRCTNRKPYEKVLLPADQIESLKKSTNSDRVKVLFTENEENKKILGKAGSTNEKVMFSNEYLHKFFFNHINWTKEEDDEKKIGFFIDTLELPPPAKAGLKLFKHWKVTNVLNKLGLYKMIGKQNAETNSKSSGFAVLVIKDKSPESFVYAGRALERLWLTSTKLNLSLQPLTGVLFFMYRILANDTGKFSKEHVDLIKNAYYSIAKIFSVRDDETIAFMCRLGFGGKPSARSSRFSVDEVISTQ